MQSKAILAHDPDFGSFIAIDRLFDCANAVESLSFRFKTSRSR